MCEDCLVLYEGYTESPQGISYNKMYLGQSGSVQVNAATYVEMGGQLRGTITNARLDEWTYTQGTDAKKADGGCYTIGAASFDAGW
ncbi:MAG: hypothetical protein JNK82_22360 [Myxococcaceae bacterium]|nr:hypothetical protein [Myxococcaceae bacterium]